MRAKGNISKILVTLVAVVLPMLTSCVTNKDLTLLQEGKKIPVYEKADYTYYKIQKNDALRIRLLTTNEEASKVFEFNSGNSSGSTSNSQYYLVYDDGTIDIPFIRSIPVAGLTVREAAKAIEERVKEFVPDAMVKCCLANDQFYIIAEGVKKSCDLYKEKLNIFQALAVSGNIASNADRSRVRIIRNDENGKPQIKEFDMRSKSIIGSEYYYIQPNDVIYISSIKGNFFKTESYAESIGFITTSLNFLVSIFNLGVMTGLYK